MSFQFAQTGTIGALPDPDTAQDAAPDDPLTVAISAADRGTLGMVQDALAHDRMRLAFQPVVYAADTTLIGYYKAYIRLLDPNGRTIPAADFMDAAEGQTLGREIDVAALSLALQTMTRNPGIRIAINMSARSIGYGRWINPLQRALRSQPQLARHLILEISEASAMQMPDMLLPFLQDLRPSGIHFLLDDFGAGATSLTLLREYSFDMVKLDGRFVRDLHRMPRHQSILRAAIALSREFGMYPIAESVETSAEAEWLRQEGVGCLQGYLFGKPEITPDFSPFFRGR